LISPSYRNILPQMIFILKTEQGLCSPCSRVKPA
jgi:hypothetical protein